MKKIFFLFILLFTHIVNAGVMFGNYGHSLYSIDSNTAALDYIGQTQTSSGYNLGLQNITYATSVPEPTILALMFTGLFGLGVARRRARK